MSAVQTKGDAKTHRPDRYADTMPEGTKARFKRWFWRPPRAHGDTIPDRTVSSLELFYDLVYVAVISQAAHHVADHVSARAFLDFAVVFALTWIAWVNGSLYLELHGREDGRTRSVVFIQMGILALLAVFAADAGGENGIAFGVVYATFLVFMTWVWDAVRRQDRRDQPLMAPIAGRYEIGMAVSAVVILASVVLPTDARLALWIAYSVGWIGAIALTGWRGQLGSERGLSPTDSLVERFALFTIIVLGEVVFGVVNGISAAEPDVKTIGTGILALWLGFGLWWIYFDILGRRRPRRDGPALATWILTHFPITLSIAAGGAAMVSLIDHAHDPTTPEATSWLLAGSVALGLVAQAATSTALADAERLALVYRPLSAAMVAGAVAALVVGWARPAPWILVVLLVTILSVVWFVAVSRFLAAGSWGEGAAEAD